MAAFPPEERPDLWVSFPGPVFGVTVLIDDIVTLDVGTISEVLVGLIEKLLVILADEVLETDTALVELGTDDENNGEDVSEEVVTVDVFIEGRDENVTVVVKGIVEVGEDFSVVVGRIDTLLDVCKELEIVLVLAAGTGELVIWDKLDFTVVSSDCDSVVPVIEKVENADKFIFVEEVGTIITEEFDVIVDVFSKDSTEPLDGRIVLVNTIDVGAGLILWVVKVDSSFENGVVTVSDETCVLFASPPETMWPVMHKIVTKYFHSMVEF